MENDGVGGFDHDLCLLTHLRHHVFRIVDARRLDGLQVTQNRRARKEFVGAFGLNQGPL